MSNRLNIALAGLLFGSLAACGDAAPPPAFASRDSAGVTIHESATPRWGEADAWSISESPTVVIGVAEGDARYRFRQVIGARRLEDGRILIGDRGASRIRVYAENGSHSMDLGSPGSEAGQFLSLQMFDALNDTLFVYEFEPAKRTRFTLDGILIDAELFPKHSSGGAVRSSAFATFTSDYVLTWSIPSNRGYTAGLNRRPLPIWRADFAQQRLDSVTAMSGVDEVISNPGTPDQLHQTYVFGKETFSSASKRQFYLAPSEAFSVQVFEPTGGLDRIVRKLVEPRTASEADHERWVGQRVLALRVPEDQRDLATEQLSSTQFAPQMPALRSITVDSEENIWVERFEDVGEGQGAFDVFGADGAWLGTVQLPLGLAADRGRIFGPWLEIGSDYVLGVWTTPQGTDQVRLYELNKPNGT